MKMKLRIITQFSNVSVKKKLKI